MPKIHDMKGTAKYIIGGFLISLFMGACSSGQPPKAAYDIDTAEEGVSTNCEGQQRFSAFKGNLDQLIEQSLNGYAFLDTIRFDSGLVTLQLSVEKGQGFYEQAGNNFLDWNYCHYHDIYSAFFAHPEVIGVMVLMGQENITYLPCRGDNDGVLPSKGIMRREWYAPNLDYGEYILLDDTSFYEDAEARMVKESILNMISSVLGTK